MDTPRRRQSDFLVATKFPITRTKIDIGPRDHHDAVGSHHGSHFGLPCRTSHACRTNGNPDGNQLALAHEIDIPVDPTQGFKRFQRMTIQDDLSFSFDWA